jgi:hypothetical protein
VYVGPHAGPGGPGGDPAQVGGGGHRQVDSGGDDRGEVLILGVQPAQHRRVDPGGAQRQRLAPGGHSQPPRTRTQRGTCHRQKPVPERVRLDHRQQIRAGQSGQQPGVVRDRVKVDDRLRERWKAGFSPENDHDASA